MMTALLLVVGSEAEVESRGMLELQRSFHAVSFATNDDQRGHEPDDLEILGELRGIPDLTVLGYQGVARTRLRVDFNEALTADRFRFVGHGSLPEG